MAHTTPAVNLAWALMTLMLGSFLIFHLWSYDRFKCLKWDHGPHSGAFKRVMTYSYLTSVPLIIVYAVGFAVLKYQYGFMFIPGKGIIPTPYELWSASSKSAVLPLYLCFSLAWGLEMVTHLEELCFWLFLVNANSAHQDWFRSVYFKVWAVGSMAAMIYMPLATIFTREDPYKCEAYSFLAGGIGSLALTIWFLPVLWAFPSFIENMKNSNVDINTLVRLTKFHELNCIRVVFRFLFTIPFVILGVDGVRPHQHINDKMFPTDLLAIIAGIGVVVSSGITLVIFFPRSIEGEMAKKEAARERRQQSMLGRRDSTIRTQFTQNQSIHTKNDVYLVPNQSHRASTYSPPSYDVVNGISSQPQRLVHKMTIEEMEHDLEYGSPAMMLQPNRRGRDGDVELGGVVGLTEGALVRHNTDVGLSSVNYLVHHWRSPIEIGGGPGW